MSTNDMPPFPCEQADWRRILSVPDDGTWSHGTAKVLLAFYGSRYTRSGMSTNPTLVLSERRIAEIEPGIFHDEIHEGLETLWRAGLIEPVQWSNKKQHYELNSAVEAVMTAREKEKP